IIEIKDFFVTAKSMDAMSWRILPSIREMIRLLNERLQLCNYGNEIDFLMFVFVILPESNQRHENYLRYSETDMILQYRIPQESVALAFPRENLSFLAHQFLEGLHFYQDTQLDGFKAFDLAQFTTDAAELFQLEEWIA
ncbi:MAG: hypothetical protein AAFP82_20065, partial [Bacteroidota bacterium]